MKLIGTEEEPVRMLSVSTFKLLISESFETLCRGTNIYFSIYNILNDLLDLLFQLINFILVD